MTSTHRRRVVITGLGIVSPLGLGLPAHWAELEAGRGGVREIEGFPVDGLPTKAAGEVRQFSPKALALDKHRKTLGKNLKYMARDIQLAVGTAELAIADSGLQNSGFDPTRIGIDLGAGMISTDLDELAPAINLASRADGSFDFEVYGRDGLREIDPLWLLKYLPNMLACHITLLNDCQGPSNTITEGEAACNAALGEAVRIIERNKADLMITGGADSKIHPLSLIRMRLQNQMSHWDGPPEQACRPFDRHRSGWVPGEGGGILLLEALDHAERRGAKIYGEVLGYGSASDAYARGGLDPHGTGAELAVRAALRDAGLQPSQVGHVNAHGNATRLADLAESRALHRVFGRDVPVTALKGYIGSLASGCGAVELISSLAGSIRGVIPTTLNCDDLDPDCEIDVVRGGSRPTDNPVFLNLNFTRHGQAAAVVVRANTDASF